ncbi:MAG: tRNA uridine-5-carboxymethylaminomethyl(34) synthesis GTPase MnmE [Gammaproteobacteria bacterium]
MTHNNDTIAAIATPPGRGGVGIIRISGPHVENISEAILGKLPKPRVAIHAAFMDEKKEALDDGIALFFPNPHSFTGENVLELQGHGGPVVLDRVLKRVVELGARLARPGEFSERAFLNNKIDLAQAEAIADLIDAESEQAARSALHSLQGEFSKKIHALVERVIHLRMYVEAAIDFPEEEIDFLKDSTITRDANTITEELQHIISQAQQGVLLREGIRVVIAGAPNAGKSSLLNALSGTESAIVTNIPGTTRDVLREHLHIDGMPMHVIDTAGLRHSEDVVELEGIRRAHAEIETADLVLHVVDVTHMHDKDNMPEIKKINPHIPVILVLNKMDLLSSEADITMIDDSVYISAKTYQGIDELKSKIKTLMGFHSTTQGTFTARRRHLDCLERANKHIKQAILQLETHNAGELFAEDSRLAQEALSEITGEFTSDDLLGKIFSTFCIGK